MPHLIKRDAAKWRIGAVALALSALAAANVAGQQLHHELHITATVGNETHVYDHLRLTRMLMCRAPASRFSEPATRR